MPAPLTPQGIDRWHRVLATAAKLQSAIPEAFLVGGTAVGIYAPYRTSRDADHLMPDLPRHYAEVLARLEALAGWSTEVVRGQHTILGRMDDIEVTLMDDGRVRQRVPLEVQTYRLQGLTLRLPTLFEILRIKSYLPMFRNMARDYADCHALSSELEDSELFQALTPLEQRYRMRPLAAWSHDGTEKPLSLGLIYLCTKEETPSAVTAYLVHGSWMPICPLPVATGSDRTHLAVQQPQSRGPSGTGPGPRARMLRAALWSAFAVCPQCASVQWKCASVLRFSLLTCPHRAQVCEVYAGGTFSTCPAL